MFLRDKPDSEFRKKHEVLSGLLIQRTEKNQHESINQQNDLCFLSKT